MDRKTADVLGELAPSSVEVLRFEELRRTTP
jgi:hypothetical protein